MAGEMFGAVLKYSGATPKLAARQRNAVQKEAFAYALKFWHAKYRDKHFTNAGATEYGYTPRKGERGSGRRFKGSYTAYKLKKMGHTRPLEFSGRSRALAARENVTSTSKGGRARINAPALNFRNRFSQINMRDEMTRVSDAERSALTREFGDYLTGRFARLTAKETVTI
jgi:hypothetical protein